MFVLSICVYPELERLKQKVGVERGQWALGEGWWEPWWDGGGPGDLRTKIRVLIASLLMALTWPSVRIDLKK